MAARKKTATAAKVVKAAKPARAAKTSLFQVTTDGKTKIVEAASAAEVRRAMLKGFSVVKLTARDALTAGLNGAEVEALQAGAELGV